MDTSDTNRTQVLSYGGGVQSVAMCVLAAMGKLPKPDLLVIADTDREAQSTWEYIDNYAAPFLARFGMKIEIAPHDLATVDLLSHKGRMLMPMYTSGGKLPTFCSNEWKRFVIMRWLRSVGVQECTTWIGYSTNEADRVKDTNDPKWYRRAYPLLYMGLNRADCEALIEDAGLPLPVKSACYMCPHRNNAEWRQIRDNYPADFEKAQQIEAEMREADPLGDVFLHKQRVPLAEADLSKPDRAEDKQCSFGYCFI